MVFLTLIVVGLVGLGVMALPALGHVTHVGRAGGVHPVAHGSHGGAHGSLRQGGTHRGGAAHGEGHAPARFVFGATRYLLSPRAIFSVLALVGAFGNALVHAGHLPYALAAGIAVAAALVVEGLVVSPLWNLMFRYEGQPSSPLYELLLSDAKAVTPFKNGRGIVAVERDGRVVQFMAVLPDGQKATRVRVGERLRVDEVDGGRECLIVSPVGQPPVGQPPIGQPPVGQPPGPEEAGATDPRGAPRSSG